MALRVAILVRDRSYWLDDVLIYRTVVKPVADMLLWRNDFFVTHGPLHLLVLSAVNRVCSSAFCLRMPGALAGALAIVPLWRIAERLFGRRTAAVFSLLLAVSGYGLEFAGELKMYPLLMLLSAWYLWVLILYAVRPSGWRFALASGVGALCMWTDYAFLWTILVSLAVVPLVARRHDVPIGRALFRIIPVHLVAVGSYTWFWIPFVSYYSAPGQAASNIAVQDQFRFRIDIPSILRIAEYYLYGRFGTVFVMSGVPVLSALRYLAVPGFVVAVVRVWRSADDRVRSGLSIAVLWYLIPFAVTAAASLVLFGGRSTLIDYHLMVSAYGLFLVVAVATVYAGQLGRTLVVGLLVVNACAFLVQLSPVSLPGKQDWRTFTARSSDMAMNAGSVAFLDAYPDAYLYYLARQSNYGASVSAITYFPRRDAVSAALHDFAAAGGRRCFVSAPDADAMVVAPALSGLLPGGATMTAELAGTDDLVMRCVSR